MAHLLEVTKGIAMRVISLGSADEYGAREGLLAPETGDGLKQGPRRGRRPEVERAAIQVVAESIADELGLADDERPGEERLDRLAEAVHVLGRDAVVVVVPGVALAHPGGIARGASYALAAPGPEMVRENSP